MEIKFEDVIEFVIKNSDHRERMDKLNKITFPFTTSYENKYSKKKSEIRLGGSGYQPSYDDMKELIESPLGTFPWDDLLINK